MPPSVQPLIWLFIFVAVVAVISVVAAWVRAKMGMPPVDSTVYQILVGLFVLIIAVVIVIWLLGLVPPGWMYPRR